MEENEKEYMENAYKAWSEQTSKLAEENMKLQKLFVEFQMEWLKQFQPEEYKSKTEEIYKEWQDLINKQSDKVKQTYEEQWNEIKSLYERGWNMMKSWIPQSEGSSSIYEEQVKVWNSFFERIKNMNASVNVSDITNTIEESYKKNMELLTQTYAKMLDETMRSPTFASLLGKQLDLSLNYRKNLEEASTELMHMYGMTTRKDFDALVKRIYEVSHRVDELEELLESREPPEKSKDTSEKKKQNQ
ncbi:MAG: hypothetical protein ACP5RS_05195 [Thermoplasmata archaeon]